MTAKTTTKGHKAPGPRISSNATDVCVINFVEDGITAFERIWYRGETLSVERGTSDWEMTLDIDGNSWMEMDEDEQIDRWGVRMFRPGKWAGKGFDLTEDHLTDEDRAALAKIEAGASTEGATEKARGTRGSRRREVKPPL